MKNKIIALIISNAIFWSCSKEDDNIPYMEGDSVFEITPDDVYIRAISPDTIFGYYYNPAGGGYTFHTFDGFKTYEFNNIPDGWSLLLMDRKYVIVIQKEIYYSNYDGFSIMKSNDYGATYKFSFTKASVDKEYIFTPVYRSFNKGIFLGISNRYDMMQQVKFYEISNNTYNVICESPWFSPYSLPKLLNYINNDELFYVDYRVNQSVPGPHYIYHSSDGGKNWNEKQVESLPPIDTRSMTNNCSSSLRIISPEKYVFLHPRSFSTWEGYDTYFDLYYSYDQGVSWNLKELNLPGYVISFQFVNDKTGYLLMKDDDELQNKMARLFKSNDAGETWFEVGVPIYAKSIHFENELIGVAVNKDIVQVTRDGGKSWRLLTYCEIYHKISF